MRSINPATAQFIREYSDHDPAQVDGLCARAHDAFPAWRARPLGERSALLKSAAGVLRRRRVELAALMTAEMGKPIVAAEAEVDKCALACDHFAGHAAEYLAPRRIATDAASSYVRYDPIGPVLAVMPWNFPFWQVFRFAAPALLAGNVGLLKHASNVPGCALAIEQVFSEAGFPAGIFTTLMISAEAAERLVAHHAIAAVTLTGSERAGMAIAAAAGKALKKSVLELGGSDPFIVLKDADIATVARVAAEARCINAGQSCIAAKRFIVEEPIASAFTKAFVQAMAGMRVGDPMERATQVGPLAREDILLYLHEQVQRTLAAGATLLTGGHRLACPGYYYEPTVLADVRPGMAAFDEETFGPVAAVITARDSAHAVALANSSRYGLGASIWTRDMGSAECLAAQIESGSVFINATVKSDPRLPFGGVKRSGYGRELAEVGMHEFVNIKTVWVEQAPAV